MSLNNFQEGSIDLEYLRYILTMVDPVSRMAFAVVIPGKGLGYTVRVLKALVEGNPEVRGLLSDRMNARNERFNRTLQEQFVDYHEEPLFTDLKGFNRKIEEWS